MKTSTFITNISLNDTDSPGQIINLNVHKIDGGYIGIDTNYTEEVANYIINPYSDIDMVKLIEADADDIKIDPNLKEDTFVCLMKALMAMCDEINLLPSLPRLETRYRIASRLRMSLDELDILLYKAQAFVDKSNEI